LIGAQAAQRLINTGRLYDVNVEAVSGRMTDHYDPRQKVLRLSQGVYQSASVASVAIAAHELGHAIQDNEGYFPLKIRSALIPAVNIGSTLGWIFIIIGLFMQWSGLAWLGVIVFSAGALFSLATLPVELNASARAKELLVQSGIIVGKEEQKGVNKVLNAAAFTYVAALLSSIMQLLYFTSLVGGMGGRRR
ncbi:MAG: zinc metallopeptidase, partial [Anaerolineales bacterium]|nr:zinc metallopeptidase [Anaerolineales bacterium]